MTRCLTITALLATLAFIAPHAAHAQTAESLEAEVTAAMADAPTPPPSEVRLVPAMNEDARIWIAIVVILILTIRPGPLLTLQNLDGIVLAFTAALLLKRGGDQVWTHTLLAACVGYWCLRGLSLFCSNAIGMRESNLTRPALLVLLITGLFIGYDRMLAHSLNDNSYEGLAGGVYMRNNAKSPHGQFDNVGSQSPLVYAVYAGGVFVADSFAGDGEHLAAQTPELILSAAAGDSYTIARGVWMTNGALLALLLIGVFVIGARLNSGAMGVTLVVLLCVFPGASEAFGDTSMLIPAVLMTWATAFALLGGLGGLLSVVLMALAVVAWPYAVFGLLLLVAYLLRRGAQAIGAVVGLAAGVAAVLMIFTQWITPSIPEAHLGLVAAGAPPAYVAQKTESGQTALDTLPPVATTDERVSKLRRSLWGLLVNRDHVKLGTAAATISMPVGADPAHVRYCSIEATGPLRQSINACYAADAAGAGFMTRFLIGLRTVLEPVWLKTEPIPVTPNSWYVWQGYPGGETASSVWPRRIVRIVASVVIVALALTLVMRRAEPRRLIGGLLTMTALTLLASAQGPAANWLWATPLILALLAIHCPAAKRPAQQQPAQQQRPGGAPAPLSSPRDPAPRITLNH